jgi:hypothetical protein
LKSYSKSLTSLQLCLQSPDALHCQGVLWCTLLLGLFEVREGLLLNRSYLILLAVDGRGLWWPVG